MSLNNYDCGKRMAIMLVSIPLLEELLGDAARPLLTRIQYGGVLNEDTEHIPEAFHDALKLPANAKITGVTGSIGFDINEVALRIECPDFRETLEGCRLPMTDATYEQTVDLLGKRVGHFTGWVGGTVGDYVPPPKPDTSRCSEALGHFAEVGFSTCYCGGLEREQGTSRWVCSMYGPPWLFDQSRAADQSTAKPDEDDEDSDQLHSWMSPLGQPPESCGLDSYVLAVQHMGYPCAIFFKHGTVGLEGHIIWTDNPGGPMPGDVIEENSRILVKFFVQDLEGRIKSHGCFSLAPVESRAAVEPDEETERDPPPLKFTHSKTVWQSRELSPAEPGVSPFVDLGEPDEKSPPRGGFF